MLCELCQKRDTDNPFKILLRRFNKESVFSPLLPCKECLDDIMYKAIESRKKGIRICLKN